MKIVQKNCLILLSRKVLSLLFIFVSLFIGACSSDSECPKTKIDNNVRCLIDTKDKTCDCDKTCHECYDDIDRVGATSISSGEPHKTCDGCPPAIPGVYSSKLDFLNSVTFAFIYPPDQDGAKKGEIGFTPIGENGILNRQITLKKDDNGGGSMSIIINKFISISLVLKDVVLEGDEIKYFDRGQ